MKHPINALRRILNYLPCYLEIKKMPKDITLKKLVEKTFNSWGKILSPLQIEYEITELLKILKRKRPKIILEIGTAKGGTLFLFSKMAYKNFTIISIDLPRGRFGGGYPVFKIPLYKSFARAKQKIYLVRKDSHKKETLEKVKLILGNKKVDFLFIDGDHTYRGVKKDFEMYSSLVKKSGIIAFHDIAKMPAKLNCRVRKFWKKLNFKYKKEIIENKNQGWGGIGVIMSLIPRRAGQKDRKIE